MMTSTFEQMKACLLINPHQGQLSRCFGGWDPSSGDTEEQDYTSSQSVLVSLGMGA
jgi:hypothetical protein